MKTTDLVPNNTNCEYWAKEIYRYPEFLDELSDYQISVLKDFLIKGKAKAASFFNDFLLANPDLKWEDIKSDDFRIYDKVLSFIESHNKEAGKKSDQKSDPEIIELITQCLQLELMREPTERELMDEIADWMKDPTMIKPGSFRPLIELIKKNNDQFQKIKDIIKHALPTIRKKFDIIPNMKFFREFIDLECELRDCSYSEILSDDPEKLIKDYAEYFNERYNSCFANAEEVKKLTPTGATLNKKTTIPNKKSPFNKLIALYIVARKEKEGLKRVSKEIFISWLKENKIESDKYNVISKERYSITSNKERISFLEKPYNGKETGYDILLKLKNGNVIVKYIQENW